MSKNNSFQNGLFRRFVSRDEISGYEFIKIDGVPKDLSLQVKQIWTKTIGQLTSDSTVENLAQQAHLCSTKLYGVLPWMFYDSGIEFDAKTNKDDLETMFYENYLKSPFDLKPDSLFDLCEDETLNCIGQSLVLNESILESNWDIYSRTKNNGHHVFVGDYGDYFVKVEPIVGPRSFSSKKESLERTYIFEREDFLKSYEKTPFLSLSVK